MKLCCLNGPTSDETLACETVEPRSWIWVTIRVCATCRLSWIVRKDVKR